MALDEADRKFEDMLKAALSPDALKPILAAAMKPISDRVEAITADLTKLREKQAETPAGEQAGKGKQGEQVPAATTARMEAIEKALADERTARRKAEADRRASETDAILRDHLRDAGIRPEFTNVLLNNFRATGVIVDDGEANQTGWRTKDQFGNDMIQTVADGISAWAASAEADHYRPSRGVAGSGDGSGTPLVGRGTVTTADGILRDLGFN